MKKIALILAVVLLLSVFAACAPKPVEPTPTLAPTPTAPPITPTEPPVTPTEPPVTPTEPPVTPTEPPVVPTPVPTQRPESPLVFQGGWERLDDVTGKSYITVTATQIFSFAGETLVSATEYVVKKAAYDVAGNMVVMLDGNDNVYTIFKSKPGVDYGEYTYMEVSMGNTIVKMIRMK